MGKFECGKFGEIEYSKHKLNDKKWVIGFNFYRTTFKFEIDNISENSHFKHYKSPNSGNIRFTQLFAIIQYEILFLISQVL